MTDNAVGMICPYCQQEITEEDFIVECPSCGAILHAGCWEENGGCITPDCPAHSDKSKDPPENDITAPAALEESNASDPSGTVSKKLCSRCGAELEENQLFCTRCGQKIDPQPDAVKKRICSRCGAEYDEGQAYCLHCGQKIGSQTDAANNNLPSSSPIKRPKIFVGKKKIITSIVVLVAVEIAVAVAVCGIIRAVDKTAGNNKSSTSESQSSSSSSSHYDPPVNFRTTFSSYIGESWCTIGYDGSYMKIDTNPNDKENGVDYEAYLSISVANTVLGFSSALMEKMDHTSALDGRQYDYNDKYKVSWSYHPNRGLEVIYERK